MDTATLETLLAKDAIHQTLKNYCRGMDRIDDALSRATWHPGGRAFYEGIFDGSGDEFCAWVADYHRGLVSTSHEIANCTIVVDGERATSETYVEVNLLREENGKHILTVGHGRYLDAWSKRDGRWAIDRRHFVNGFSYTSAIDPRLGPARRDPGDASYALFDGAAQ